MEIEVDAQPLEDLLQCLQSEASDAWAKQEKAREDQDEMEKLQDPSYVPPESDSECEQQEEEQQYKEDDAAAVQPPSDNSLDDFDVNPKLTLKWAAFSWEEQVEQIINFLKFGVFPNVPGLGHNKRAEFKRRCQLFAISKKGRLQKKIKHTDVVTRQVEGELQGILQLFFSIHIRKPN